MRSKLNKFVAEIKYTLFKICKMVLKFITHMLFLLHFKLCSRWSFLIDHVIECYYFSLNMYNVLSYRSTYEHIPVSASSSFLGTHTARRRPSITTSSACLLFLYFYIYSVFADRPQNAAAPAAKYFRYCTGSWRLVTRAACISLASIML